MDNVRRLPAGPTVTVLMPVLICSAYLQVADMIIAVVITCIQVPFIITGVTRDPYATPGIKGTDYDHRL